MNTIFTVGVGIASEILMNKKLVDTAKSGKMADIKRSSL
jgi:hypothetical protein